MAPIRSILLLLCLLSPSKAFIFLKASRTKWYLEQSAATDDRPKGSAFTPKKERPRLPILNYHDNYVVINKPAGMSVHRGRQPSSQSVVVATLKRQLARKVWPVHRLDHRTSGALVLAFDGETSADLHSALRQGRKTYIALLRGEWRLPQERIQLDEPLLVDGELKSASTVFTHLATLSNIDSPVTLVTAELLTGRTHQIRRHAARLSRPVIGDTQHGDTRVNRWWREQRGLNRLALHCLAINLPYGDANLEITAPLHEDLARVLQADTDFWQAAVRKEPRLATPWIDERGGTRTKGGRFRTFVE